MSGSGGACRRFCELLSSRCLRSLFSFTCTLSCANKPNTARARARECDGGRAYFCLGLARNVRARDVVAGTESLPPLRLSVPLSARSTALSPRHKTLQQCPVHSPRCYTYVRARFRRLNKITSVTTILVSSLKKKGKLFSKLKPNDKTVYQKCPQDKIKFWLRQIF